MLNTLGHVLAAGVVAALVIAVYAAISDLARNADDWADGLDYDETDQTDDGAEADRGHDRWIDERNGVL
ncbi:hypothetical protein B7C42_01602 [Nocardia cerradoensis]|uniref:Uncharacterized protein n=1 Tax=Nocardia cerradoensis TaxID=85688 RepID=A0A231HCY1_9NOCA|nr:hypothetical protein [Nocardia cerradoensis]OXR46628.1 hypothetical protein B7C42_01602 [Nocardia cerradoensis]